MRTKVSLVSESTCVQKPGHVGHDPGHRFGHLFATIEVKEAHMSVPPIKLELTWEERRALEEIAVQDMRRPSEMLRWLLREELNRRQTKHNGAAISQDTPRAVAAIAG